MNQDATWYGSRPQPRRLCVRWGPSYPRKKGTPTSTQFLAHVCCGQTAGWMKTPLGTEVVLGPGHIVLDGVPAIRERGTSASSFRRMSIMATVAHLIYCLALMEQTQAPCAESTGHGNDFELFPMVKMETIHPVDGSFDKEFSSIYNPCGDMAVLKGHSGAD